MVNYGGISSRGYCRFAAQSEMKLGESCGEQGDDFNSNE
jgi:hypothetical protein